MNRPGQSLPIYAVIAVSALSGALASAVVQRTAVAASLPTPVQDPALTNLAKFVQVDPSGNVAIVGTQVSIKGTSVTVSGSSSTAVGSGGTTSLTGTSVSVAGTAATSVTGANVTVNGSGQTAIKGSVVTIN